MTGRGVLDDMMGALDDMQGDVILNHQSCHPELAKDLIMYNTRSFASLWMT